MAAQVEVQTGEVGRVVAGGRLHLSPLTDSSNTSLIEIPSINQPHIITPEPKKPLPAPKPRLTPKPFTVEKNPTIKPILAPKPQAKPRPESTHLAGYRPDLPSCPKPQQPVASSKPRLASNNPSRPSSTSYRTSTKLTSGQTHKPVVQPFKPAPPLEPVIPSQPIPPKPPQRQKPGPSSLTYSKSLKNLSAAEWSGATKKEKDQMTSTKDGASMTRAKSMGSLTQMEQEGDEKEKNKPEANVPLQPQPKRARPRPVSAIFLSSPTQSEAPVPAPRWAGRRPLSADLTSKFESIGLSLHRKTLKANTKENTPEENALPQRQEQEKNLNTMQAHSTDVANPVASDQQSKKKTEVVVKETDEDKRGVGIKSRINLLLDSSSSSPGAGATGQMSDPHSPVQPVSENEPSVGVKKLIKQLTEDTTPTQSPTMKPVLKPRPLPLDWTKRFSSERSPDIGSISFSESTEHHEISKDPQKRLQESAITLSDQRTLVDFEEHLKKTSVAVGPEGGQMFGAASAERAASGEVQTVRASLFENVVERHSVLMVDEGKPVNKALESCSSPSSKRGNGEDDGTLVTATYKEPVSPSPVRVLHALDTVQAVDESRAVSESIPAAQWEDKALTLRSRRSEGNRLVAERTGLAQGEPTKTITPEQQPRYLRVGALHKWTATGLDQDADVEKGILKQSQGEEKVALNKDRERQREIEQEEAAASPKRLKMLQAEEQPKPRATYFALTGQMQEPGSPVDAQVDIGDKAVPYDDFSVRSAQGSSQGRVLSVRRNQSLDEVLRNPPQDQVEDLRTHISHRDSRSASDGQTVEEIMEVERRREVKKEAERHKSRMKELEREKERVLELEKQAHLEFARMKERDMQREFERQRQKAFEREKQEFEEKQLALEKQKQLELEKQRLQELEREKQRELERERQRQLEKEKQRALERQKEMERERLQELEKKRQHERERQRQKDEERQRELDKERQLLEIQKEKLRMDELERMKEVERKQLLEFQKQKQKEAEMQQLMELEKQRLREKREREEAQKIKQMVLEQEMLRLREIEKERERQREMEREHQKEIEREKQREFERQRQRDLEKERQKQLDMEREELEKQRLRRRELELERLRREELERIKEMERRQLLEFEKQKQADRDKQILETEKRRLKDKMEKEEAEKMRQVAKQQEAERQRLKEKQRKEEQERLKLESSPLRPKVVDLDSIIRHDPFSKAPSQRSDPSTRWKEPSPRAEEPYKPTTIDIDFFTSQTQPSSTKDLFPVSSVQSVDSGFGGRFQTTPERDVSWKVPPPTSVGFTSPIWATSPQDPWELLSVEMSVDKPLSEPRKHAIKLSPEQLLARQEDWLLPQQRHWPSGLEPLPLSPFAGTEAKTGGSPGAVSSSAPAEQVWFPREPQPQDSRGEVQTPRRSQGSQELSRLRSRSMSRQSAPPSNPLERSLSRVRSRSAHREQDHHSWVQQKQSVSGEEEGKDSEETQVLETDSQYGTWETGLRTDDSLSPATPSSESNLSPSPRKPTPSHAPGEPASLIDTEILGDVQPSASSDNQLFSFPDAPTYLLDNSALRSRAQLAKKRGIRTRPTRAAHQSAAQAEGGSSEDWIYRDSTEEKAQSKMDDSDSEEQATGADTSPAVASQPQRIALFPGVDPLALKAQLKKRGDSDSQTDGPSPSQLSRSPKSPFLPRAAHRVLPPVAAKENGEEDSPQWLKELKSKKRLSQYENES